MGSEMCIRDRAWSGRHADMEGFSSDLTKKGIPIGSGLTKVTREDGFEYLLGLHEAPYLEHNRHALLSTGQARESGTWVKDVMLHHGGNQRIIGWPGG